MKDFKNSKTLVNSNVNGKANEIVKEFISSIKDSLKDARKVVQGEECESLNQLGKAILRRDEAQLGTVTFYAGFNDDNSALNSVMTINEINEYLKTETLTFFKVRYTGNGKCKKFKY